jgi:hypothetical protein
VNVLVGQFTAVKSLSPKVRQPRPVPSMVALGVVAVSAASNAPGSSIADQNNRGFMPSGWFKVRRVCEPKQPRGTDPIRLRSMGQAAP